VWKRERKKKKNHLESCMYSFISLSLPPSLALLLLLIIRTERREEEDEKIKTRKLRLLPSNGEVI
jgi:hypothetical protein